MAKLWGGRFKTGLDESAIKFSYSLSYDSKLASYDIAVNRAHAKALTQAGIFTQTDLNKVCLFLDDLEEKIEAKEDIFSGTDEDIHSCIERLMTEALGDLGKRLHTGKSRNDQVITDFRLFTKDQSTQVMGLINEVLQTLYDLADANLGVIFPGFTHFQTAQPVLLSHHLLAYFEKFSRDMGRFEKVFETADACALGSGALAGNNYGLDRQFIADELGFSRITNNSLDAVSDRDFVLEFCSSASICMTHLSRFSEELILWSSPLIGFITIGDNFTTGSSIMPQKKNPDIAELIRGKTGRVLGHFVGMQHILKALPLAYNRDLQEDKELLFDTADTLSQSLECFYKMLRSVTFNTEVIEKSMQKGHILATDFADYLVKKGVPFRDSHEITGRAVLYGVENKKEIHDLSLDEFKQFSDKIEEDVFEHLTLQAAIDAKNVLGGTATNQVVYQLEKIKESYGW